MNPQHRWLAVASMAALYLLLAACGGGGGGGGAANPPPTPPAPPTPSSNANLANLTVAGATLTASFDPGVLSYSADAPFLVLSVDISASPEDANASVTLDGNALGAAPQNLRIAEGDNPVTITVTAEDGTTTQDYVVTVTRASGDGQRLMGVDDGVLYRIDETTGIATRVSGYGLAGFENVEALAVHPSTGVAYGIDSGSRMFLEIDTSTGEAVVIGPLGDRGILGLAFDPNDDTLYGTSTTADALVTIDLTTANVTVVGSTNFPNIESLAFHAGTMTLYGVDSLDDELIAIDTATGAGTSLGPVGFRSIEGLTYDAGSNLLYASDTASERLIAIDPSLGASGWVVRALPTAGMRALAHSGVLLLGADGVGDRLVEIPLDDVGDVVGSTGLDLIRGLAFDPNNGILYGTDADLRRLVTVDVQTGTTSVIGDFGLVAAGIRDLAFDARNDILYATDFSQNRLLTIDTGTGAASEVATLPDRTYVGLAFAPDQGVLYASDTDSDELLAIDPAGTTTVIGPLGFDLVRGLAFDAPSGTLWGTDGATNQLLNIDTGTGAATAVADWTGTNVRGLAFDPAASVIFGAEEDADQLIAVSPISVPVGAFGFPRVRALARDPGSGTVYGSDTLTDQLISIDTDSGQGQVIGATGFNRVEGLAFDSSNGVLYGVDINTDQLLTIDTVSGVATPVGPLGFDNVAGLAYDPSTGTLYGTDIFDAQLIRVDTTSGAGTSVGPLGVTFVDALVFDDATQTLYATEMLSGTLLTIDTATGAATEAALLPTLYEGHGLIAIDSQLIGVGNTFSGNHLVRIDSTSGSLTSIGALGFPTARALAWDSDRGVLYGANFLTDLLLTIDPVGGTATTGVDSGVDGLNGLAMDSATQTLYLTEGPELLALDVATDTVSPIGPLNVGDDVQGLTLDEASGTLYGVTDAFGDLITIDRSDASVTVVGATGAPSIWALAYEPTRQILYGVGVTRGDLIALDVATGESTSIAPMTRVTTGLTAVY